MKIIVTGGRYYSNKRIVYEALDRLEPTCIIQGGASGADELAICYAIDKGIQFLTYKADWSSNGKAAGPIRNRKMLKENIDAIVLAFFGGRGTANCVKEARKLKMEVLEIE